MSPSKAKAFTVVLEPLQNGLGWVAARVPFDIAKAWPVRRGTRVRGEIEGFPFRTSLMPYADGGGHFLLVNKKMQAGAKVGAGAKVRVQLEPDLEDQVAEVPAELVKELKGDRLLRRWFDRLTPGMRRWIGDQVTAPKSAAARQRRAEQTAEWLMLAMEGELETPPILKVAFQRQPLARVGWEAMTVVQRRNHLLGIFHLQGAEARERRVASAVEECLSRVRKKTGNAWHEGS